MSVAPLPLPRQPAKPDGRPRPERIVGSRTRARSLVTRRRISVRLAKRLLPVVALALLSLVALWPELGGEDRNRFGFHATGLEPQSGELTDVHYNGVDERGRPYTMTARRAIQASPERINLTEPKGDVSLESGSWLMVQSHTGVYAQHTGQLDLSGDVVLYRDDGVSLITDAATVDLRAGAATSAEKVHAEGPFGTLDAQGFTLTDRGADVHFAGPGRLVLNGHHP